MNSAYAAFDDFHHVNYVTTDLDEAIRTLQQRYGMRVVALGENTVVTVEQKTLTMRLGLGFNGAFGIEVIQPTGGADDIYRQVLPSSGFAMKFHHLAFSAPNREKLQMRRDEMVQQGHAIVLEGQSASFFYADARHYVGHYIEYAVVDDQVQGVIDQIRAGTI